ncbi:MAG: PEP-CTERM sorting domain-containing protein [Colwellia sp.]|nr:PEP-CTERM sorting domain-containing protein [Colwellia sp.]
MENLKHAARIKEGNYSLGGLLDNISLVQISNGPAVDVPEPSAFALSLMGFALLVRRQHKSRNSK